MTELAVGFEMVEGRPMMRGKERGEGDDASFQCGGQQSSTPNP